jgi:hypothetical protein
MAVCRAGSRRQGGKGTKERIADLKSQMRGRIMDDKVVLQIFTDYV